MKSLDVTQLKYINKLRRLLFYIIGLRFVPFLYIHNEQKNTNNILFAMRYLFMYLVKLRKNQRQFQLSNIYYGIVWHSK